MERTTSAHDGSLNAVRNDIKALERGLEKEQNRRRALRDELRETQARLDVMMDFLDGMRRNGYVFQKKPFAGPSVEEETPETVAPG